MPIRIGSSSDQNSPLLPSQGRTGRLGATTTVSSSPRSNQATSSNSQSKIHQVFDQLRELLLGADWDRPETVTRANDELRALMNAPPKALAQLLNSDQFDSVVRLRELKQLLGSPKSIIALDMAVLCRQSLARPAIEAFAERQHTNETLAFLDAVHEFRQLCHARFPNMAAIKEKFAQIKDTFIGNHARSPINLPDPGPLRTALDAIDLNNATVDDLRNSFDQAEEEIARFFKAAFITSPEFQQLRAELRAI